MVNRNPWLDANSRGRIDDGNVRPIVGVVGSVVDPVHFINGIGAFVSQVAPGIPALDVKMLFSEESA
jgi:hypothetical protein